MKTRSTARKNRAAVADSSSGSERAIAKVLDVRFNEETMKLEYEIRREGQTQAVYVWRELIEEQADVGKIEAFNVKYKEKVVKCTILLVDALKELKDWSEVPLTPARGYWNGYEIAYFVQRVLDVRFNDTSKKLEYYVKLTGMAQPVWKWREVLDYHPDKKKIEKFNKKNKDKVKECTKRLVNALDQLRNMDEIRLTPIHTFFDGEEVTYVVTRVSNIFVQNGELKLEVYWKNFENPTVEDFGNLGSNHFAVTAYRNNNRLKKEVEELIEEVRIRELRRAREAHRKKFYIALSSREVKERFKETRVTSTSDDEKVTTPSVPSSSGNGEITDFSSRTSAGRTTYIEELKENMPKFRCHCSKPPRTPKVTSRVGGNRPRVKSRSSCKSQQKKGNKHTQCPCIETQICGYIGEKTKEDREYYYQALDHFREKKQSIVFSTVIRVAHQLRIQAKKKSDQGKNKKRHVSRSSALSYTSATGSKSKVNANAVGSSMDMSHSGKNASVLNGQQDYDMPFEMRGYEEADVQLTMSPNYEGPERDRKEDEDLSFDSAVGVNSKPEVSVGMLHRGAELPVDMIFGPVNAENAQPQELLAEPIHSDSANDEPEELDDTVDQKLYGEVATLDSQSNMSFDHVEVSSFDSQDETHSPLEKAEFSNPSSETSFQTIDVSGSDSQGYHDSGDDISSAGVEVTTAESPNSFWDNYGKSDALASSSRSSANTIPGLDGGPFDYLPSSWPSSPSTFSSDATEPKTTPGTFPDIWEQKEAYDKRCAEAVLPEITESDRLIFPEYDHVFDIHMSNKEAIAYDQAQQTEKRRAMKRTREEQKKLAMRQESDERARKRLKGFENLPLVQVCDLRRPAPTENDDRGECPMNIDDKDELMELDEAKIKQPLWEVADFTTISILKIDAAVGEFVKNSVKVQREVVMKLINDVVNWTRTFPEAKGGKNVVIPGLVNFMRQISTTDCELGLIQNDFEGDSVCQLANEIGNVELVDIVRRLL